MHDDTKRLLGQVDDAWQRLKLDAAAQELEVLEQRLTDPELWQDAEAGTAVSKQAAALEARIVPWRDLRRDAKELDELIGLEDASLTSEIAAQLRELTGRYEALKKELRYQGPYDNHAAIVRLSAGAGGTDAQDWTEMLERMYLRWSEKAGLAQEILEESKGEEAGLKSAVLRIDGAYAYGKLKSEHGVHRLVRLSPFNSDNLRQTSFALVEILPEIAAPDEVAIDDKDLKIDVYRSGGKGGQSVNTTDSAVRVTHLPTGIVVAIQNERSQLQNKETALKILRSKLAQLQLEQHAETLSDLQAGESANWGSQIRNYVLHPYTLVKDTRTKHEDRDAAGVLDGKLDDFMEAYAEHTAA